MVTKKLLPGWFDPFIAVFGVITPVTNLFITKPLVFMPAFWPLFAVHDLWFPQSLIFIGITRFQGLHIYSLSLFSDPLVLPDGRLKFRHTWQMAILLFQFFQTWLPFDGSCRKSLLYDTVDVLATLDSLHLITPVNTEVHQHLNNKHFLNFPFWPGCVRLSTLS